MGVKAALGSALMALLAVSCAPSTVAPARSQPDASSVIKDFDLYTHCGIRETRVGSDYYVATPVLSDGHGNPPSGWGNPNQPGTMTLNPDGTAHFSAAGSLTADFRIRPNATDWLMICK